MSHDSRSPMFAVALIGVVVASCAGRPAVAPSGATPVVTDVTPVAARALARSALARSAPAQPSDSITTPAEALAVGCPLTVPDLSFEPPPPTPAEPPAYYRSGWYGNAHLWTMIGEHGEVWQSLPHGPDGLGQKTFWWSSDWHVDRELEPAITVSGRRLDAAGSFVLDPPGTNAEADFGVAMLAGVDIPSRGCWEITGSYRAVSLSMVVWVEDN